MSGFAGGAGNCWDRSFSCSAPDSSTATYNVLLSSDGPVIIDLPQAINAAGNNNAADMFLRDVTNMTVYFDRFAPELLATDYGREIWRLYATGQLLPTTLLTGNSTF